jgi:transposase
LSAREAVDPARQSSNEDARRQGLRQRRSAPLAWQAGTKAVVPNKSNRKQPFSFDKESYKQRHRIENAFCGLKDFRRIATRYDRIARNFLASVCLVAAIVWWI